MLRFSQTPFVCARSTRGDHLWSMIESIAKLRRQKIVWDPDFDKDNTEVFILSVDGTDFRVWEPKHPTLPVDKQYCSHKHKKGALRYEIGISLKTSQVVWLSGPHPAGQSDLQIWQKEGGLGQRMRKGKMAIADGTYQGSRKLAKPDNGLESKELNNFKSRARLRQETFNGRLKKFEALNQIFRHSQRKHKFALEAICVICQNAMDLGSKQALSDLNSRNVFLTFYITIST